MNVLKLTRTTSLVFLCLLVLIFTSISPQALAQEGILDKTKEGLKKGGEEVKKGAETVGEKTKEGAEAIGRGVKKAVTGDDDDKDSINREKGTEAQPQKPTGNTSTSTEGSTSGGKEMPATAGELPLLALAGALAFASAAVSRVLLGIGKPE